MNVRYRTRGIILEAKDQREADRAFLVLTQEFGLVALWAVSCRKIASKLRGGLCALSCSDIEFVQGKNRKTVTDARLVSLHPISHNLEGLRAAMRMAKTLTLLLPAEDPDERVWELALRSLQGCADVREPKEGRVAYYGFFWNMMDLLGYGVSRDIRAALSRASGLSLAQERDIAAATKDRFHAILIRS